MKIALILDHFFPHKGGAESAVYQLACYLKNKQQDVHILTQNFDEKLKTQFVFHPLPISLKIGGLSTLLFGKKVGLEVQKQDFDIVLGFNKTWQGMNCFQPHGGTTLASRQQNIQVYPSTWGRFWKKVAHLFSLKQGLFLWIERQQYQKTDCTFFALSQMVKGHMQKFYQVPESQIQVIYNGVDLSKFHPEQKPIFRQQLEEQHPELCGKIVFLFVAHNFKLKGLAPLIQAFAQAGLPSEKFCCLILGRGKKAPFQKLIQQYEMEPNFLFLEADTEPEKYFCASDVFVHPTFYDPCSLVLLEAMAAGLPCLTSKFNGAGELLKHGESGLIVEHPWNILEMASYLRQFQEADFREKLGKSARSVAEEYPWERSFEAMFQVFQQIVHAKSSKKG